MAAAGNRTPRQCSLCGQARTVTFCTEIKETPILRTIESNRFVTGVTWVDGELWHGTWEGDESELRCVEPTSGEVRERLSMPPGTGISGLESDGAGTFFCGGGSSGKVRAVKRPKKAAR